jgi:UDP-2,3-diacylglucosamine hydrolase
VASSLFVSDLHLSEERPEANERFIAFVEETASAAGALYVLGDLFEYWIGDDDLEEPFNAVMGGFFARLVRSGVPVFLMHGNRDFLVGERFCRATGVRLLEDPALVELGGLRTLLMHGDTLCTDDLDYQGWRRTARSAEWQREFLAKPLASRRDAVGALREKSREVIRAKPAEIMDVNEEAVREALHRHRADRLIHGHTHRPGRHEVSVEGRRCERWVLPDWYGAGGYLEVPASGKARLIRW